MRALPFALQITRACPVHLLRAVLSEHCVQRCNGAVFYFELVPDTGCIDCKPAHACPQREAKASAQGEPACGCTAAGLLSMASSLCTCALATSACICASPDAFAFQNARCGSHEHAGSKARHVAAGACQLAIPHAGPGRQHGKRTTTSTCRCALHLWNGRCPAPWQGRQGRPSALDGSAWRRALPLKDACALCTSDCSGGRMEDGGWRSCVRHKCRAWLDAGSFAAQTKHTVGLIC